MKSFLHLTICLVLIAACKQEILVPDTGRKLVINGLISTDELFNVSITQSGILPDFAYQYQHPDIKAALYKNNIFVDSLYSFPVNPNNSDQLMLSGNYRSKNTVPLPRDEYKIVVNAKGFPEASSSAKVPGIVKVNFIDSTRIVYDTARIVYTGIDNQTFGHLTGIDFVCNIEFTDPADKANYYLLFVHRIPRVDNDSIKIYFDSPDPIIEEKLRDYNSVIGIAFSDRIINGKKHKIPIYINCQEFGYPFYDDRMRTYTAGQMVVGPITKKTFYFRLYSIDEGFFKYIQTLNLYKHNFGDPLSDPVLMPSNVNGGYGIFSGAAVSVDSLVYKYHQ
jgi:hypothetical protein